MTRSVCAGVGVAVVVAALSWGCRGPVTDSKVRARQAPPLREMDFDLIARIPTGSDSPGVTWSPDSAALVYTGPYLDPPLRPTVMRYDVTRDAEPRVLFDPADHPFVESYVAYHPVFLDADHVAVSQALDAWASGKEPSTVIDTASGEVSANGPTGMAVRVSSAGLRLVSERLDLQRVTSDAGLNVELPMMTSMRPWSEDGYRLLGWVWDEASGYPSRAILLVVDFSSGEAMLSRRGVLAEGRWGADPSVDSFQLRWAPDGRGAIYIADGESGEVPYDPRWEHGDLMHLDFAVGERRTVHIGARNPAPIPDSPYVLMDTLDGPALTDLYEVRTFTRDLKGGTEWVPSPDGRRVVGLSEDYERDLLIFSVER